MSNKAMPGLLKVGYSTKDPVLRVEELSGTGHPHPFCVEYDALVWEPRVIEQAVHLRLSDFHEAKEFFRITIDTAVSAIYAEIAARNEKVIVEEKNFACNVSGTRAWGPNHCSVCGASIAKSDNRCPKCFAMLP